MGGQSSKQPNLGQEFEELFKSPNKMEFTNRINNVLNQKITNFQELQFSEEFIREMVQKRAEFFEQFLFYLIDFLEQITLQTTGMNEDEENLTRNVVRVLAKVIPVLNEKDHEDLMTKLLWDYENQNFSLEEVGIKQGQVDQRMVIIRADENDIQHKREESKPYGIKLISALQYLLFYEDFTIRKNPKTKFWVIPGYKEHGQSNHKSRFFDNRRIVLECVLACLGQSLYRKNDKKFINPYVSFLVSQKNQNNENLFFSLLNFVLVYREKYFIKMRDMSEGESLATLCIHVLLIILDQEFDDQELINSFKYSKELHQIFDFYLMPQTDIDSPSSSNSQMQKSMMDMLMIFRNNWLVLFTGLALDDLMQVVKNLLDILDIPIRNSQKFTPILTQEVNYVREVICVLYKVVKYHPKILALFNYEEQFTRLFKIIIYYFCLYDELDDQHTQEVHMIILSILIQLTQNQDFALFFNNQLDFSYNFKTFPIIQGSYADLLIASLSSHIINRISELRNTPIFNFMSVILNISPFVQNLQRITCVKLLQMYNIFANYDFLLQNQWHPYCLIKLMKIFDQVINFNAKNNADLIFELWKRKQTVIRCQKFNFDEKTIEYVLNDPSQTEHFRRVLMLSEQIDPSHIKQVLKNQWKNFNWKGLFRQSDFFNIFQVFRQIDNLVEKSKISIQEVDLKMVQLLVQKEDCIKSLSPNKTLVLENFQNNGFVNYMTSQFIWKTILRKNDKYFGYQQSLYFNQFFGEEHEKSDRLSQFIPKIISSTTTQADRRVEHDENVIMEERKE